MSLTRFVARKVADMGSATLDELHTELSEYSRDQVFQAVKNARTLGLIHCFNRSRAGFPPSQHSRNYPGRKPRSLATANPFPQAVPAPPASVWDLAGREPMAWPPQGQGRKFSPLGGWTD